MFVLGQRHYDPLTCRQLQRRHFIKGDVLLPTPADSTNSGEFVGFLGTIHRTYGKAALILDSTSYKSKKVGKGPEEMNGDIKLIFLPPHAPQLNPAKVRAATFKKRLAGRCFDSSEYLKQTIRDLTDAGEAAPVRQTDYMLPAKAGTPEGSWHRFLRGCAPYCA